MTVGTDCECGASPPVEAWERPLLSQRKGMRSDGLPGQLQGCIVDGLTYPHPAAARAILARRSAEKRAEGEPHPLAGPPPGNPLAAFHGDRRDALGVEVVVDGERLIEPTPGHWVSARTGKPWRRPRRQEVAR